MSFDQLEPNDPRRTSNRYGQQEPESDFRLFRHVVVPTVVFVLVITVLVNLLRIGLDLIGPLFFLAMILLIVSLFRGGRFLLTGAVSWLVTFGERISPFGKNNRFH